MKSAKIKLVVFSVLTMLSLGSHADTVYLGNLATDTIDLFTPGGGGSIFASGLNGPRGLAFDPAGNLYVVDNAENVILEYTPNGVGSVFAETGNGPFPLAFDNAGNLYVGNTGDNTIEKFSPNGVGSIFADTGSTPFGLACDGSGNVYAYVAGPANQYMIEKFASNGIGSIFSGVTNIGGLCCDGEGILYAIVGGGVIEKFTADGVGSVFASNNFAELSGLAFDRAGNLFAVDRASGTVEEYTPAGVGSVFGSNNLGEATFEFDFIAVQPSVVITNQPQTIITSLPTAYKVVDLGALPGTDTSEAYAINDAEQVIGVSFTAADEHPMGFIWDATNGIRDLDVPSSTGDVQPTGINSEGVVVGYSWDPWPVAFEWDSLSGVQGIGFGSIDGYTSYVAVGINDAGAMAYEDYGYDLPPARGYLLSDGAATYIGELFPGGLTWCQGLNNNNEIAGQCTSAPVAGNAPALAESFFWAPDQAIIGLGYLPGYTNSIALSIDDASQVVGYCYNSDGTSGAFIWTPGTGILPLDCSEIGGSNSVACGINLNGIAVGRCQIGSTNHAVAWPPGRGAVDLSGLAVNLSGWVLIEDVGGVGGSINSSGVIVGQGLMTNGTLHACILYPLTLSITNQPVSQVANWGQNATFSVGATAGNPPLSYQWNLNSTPILGATNASLVLTNLQFTNAGAYSVVVSDSAGGVVTSTSANLTVNPAGVSLGLYPGVTINGTVGYNYIVQRTANLAITNGWVTVANLTLTQPVQLWVDTNVNSVLLAIPQQFYRVLPGQ